jgi:hypothetical protein
VAEIIVAFEEPDDISSFCNCRIVQDVDERKAETSIDSIVAVIAREPTVAVKFEHTYPIGVRSVYVVEHYPCPVGGGIHYDSDLGASLPSSGLYVGPGIAVQHANEKHR